MTKHEYKIEIINKFTGELKLFNTDSVKVALAIINTVQALNDASLIGGGEFTVQANYNAHM